MGIMWVFGYGSLMWNPGFPVADSATARLMGWHRALCIHSFHHRGTEAQPGLVLGLDRGGSCIGRVLQVEPGTEEETLAYLRARELISGVYNEVTRPARLLDGSGRTVDALVYVARRDHCQYAGSLDREEILTRVQAAHGKAGPNADYVVATADHLSGLGLVDPVLHWLRDRLAPGDTHVEDPGPGTGPG